MMTTQLYKPIKTHQGIHLIWCFVLCKVYLDKVVKNIFYQEWFTYIVLVMQSSTLIYQNNACMCLVFPLSNIY